MDFKVVSPDPAPSSQLSPLIPSISTVTAVHRAPFDVYHHISFSAPLEPWPSRHPEDGKRSERVNLTPSSVDPSQSQQAL